MSRKSWRYNKCVISLVDYERLQIYSRVAKEKRFNAKLGHFAGRYLFPRDMIKNHSAFLCRTSLRANINVMYSIRILS